MINTFLRYVKTSHNLKPNMNPIEDLGLRWHLIKMEIGGFTVKEQEGVINLGLGARGDIGE